MEAIETYNKLKTPPPSALKPITGGRLSGMTDIKPQWRIEVMTKTFGLCGIGWKYVILEQKLESASDNQVVGFVKIDLYIKIEDKWSDPIPGLGGASFIAKEKNGMYSSDEVFKMALTDALSVAMKAIGVGADIYMGRWDGTKYKSSPENKPQTKEPYEDLDKAVALFKKESEFVSSWDDLRKIYIKFKALQGAPEYEEIMKTLNNEFNPKFKNK